MILKQSSQRVIRFTDVISTIALNYKLRTKSFFFFFLLRRTESYEERKSNIFSNEIFKQMKLRAISLR